MWNSTVCRLWFNLITFKSNCLRTFLFWDASIIFKLVSLKISLICCCWRFWFDMSMSTLSLSIGHSHQQCLILQKANWGHLQKQIVLTFVVPAHLCLNYYQRSILIFSWIKIVNWLSILRSVWPSQWIQLRFHGMTEFCSFVHRQLVGHCQLGSTSLYLHSDVSFFSGHFHNQLMREKYICMGQSQ